MKQLLQWLLGLMLAVVILLGMHHLIRNTAAPRPVDPTPITLEEVSELSELVTLTVPQQQIVETELAGYSGATRCLLLARGEALLATDLAAVKLAFDEARGQVTVTLPPPRVLTATLDQSRSRAVLVARSGLWAYVPGEAGEMQVTEDALSRAQQQMARAAGEPDRIAQAKRKTRHVLADWFKRQGWSLQLQWRPP